ncbi:hypothetical protein psyc5s11_21480 [Clostridium gelidum]|uniref:Uncharacterized protein n=1 Tax=Clostridium gelidum TaxID=704125 RepID=A0ABN6IZD5_9CLOT|nr:hypothetical protein [Clostridium gelidum]BCZ46081.1 hypothetical protein psyc5s11_21480 [Clostridium gelidum]
MKISILKELKISLFKPHLYFELKNLSFGRILLFNFINALMAVLFSLILNFFVALFSEKIIWFGDYLQIITFKNLIITFLYMVFGLTISSLALSGLLKLVMYWKKTKHVNYVYLFNYATHSLLICALLNKFVGVYVIVFALGYCLMAVSKDTLKAQSNK